MDWLILGLGFSIFTVQLILSWRSLQWRGTRFFIPRIDVLTLLFCIFLLMPIIRENENLAEDGPSTVAVATDLQKEIEARQKRLQELYDAEHRAQIALAQLEKKPGEFVRK